MAKQKPSDRRRGGVGEEIGEPDLIPIMNLTFILIAGVLTMSSLAIGLISVQAPQLSSGGNGGAKPKEEKKALNLTIFVKQNGFDLAASGATKSGSTATPPRPGEAYLPRKSDGKLDYQALQKFLVQTKKVFKDESSVIIVGDPDILYDEIVQTMDAARKTPDTILFPAVAFSPGIIG